MKKKWRIANWVQEISIYCVQFCCYCCCWLYQCIVFGRDWSIIAVALVIISRYSKTIIICFMVGLENEQTNKIKLKENKKKQPAALLGGLSNLIINFYIFSFLLLLLLFVNWKSNFGSSRIIIIKRKNLGSYQKGCIY